MRLCLALLAAWALGAAAQNAVPDLVSNTNYYNPCLQPNSSVANGEPFVFGIAWWPGGTVEEWGAPINTTSGIVGYNPCNKLKPRPDNTTQDHREYLNAKGVVFGYFAVNVDTMAVVRSTRAEEDVIFDAIVGSRKVLSMIAFRNEWRSEARYIRSGSSFITGGTGVVKEMALMLNFDKGNFQGFEWYDFTNCDECGGLGSSECVQTQYDELGQTNPQHSCATPLSDCTCRGLACNSTSPCSTATYVGFRGNDRYGRPMYTADQLQAAYQYSISGLFSGLLESLNNLLANNGQLASAAATRLPSGSGTTDADLAAAQSQQAG